MAIALALRALEVGPGHEVLVPTYHCPTMIAPIRYLGATPVFFPIDGSGAADIGFLRRTQNRRVKAVIAAHYFGFPQGMLGLRAFCDEHGIALIEDCAHAMFGGDGDGRIGELGDFAIGSLTKFFPVREGGCLVHNTGRSSEIELQDPGLVTETRALADIVETSVSNRRLTGLNTGLGLLFRAKTFTSRIHHLLIPGTFAERSLEVRPTSYLEFPFSPLRPTRATRWVVTHSDLHRIVSLRRRNYLDLINRLKSLPGARPLFPELPGYAVPYVFPLWLDEPDPHFQALLAHGLPVFRWNWLWPSTPEIPGDEGRQWAHHVIQLPCHQDLSRLDLDWMVEKLHEVFH